IGGHILACGCLLFLSGMAAFGPMGLSFAVQSTCLFAGCQYRSDDRRIELVLTFMHISVLVFEPQGKGAKTALFAAEVFRTQRRRQGPGKIVLAIGRLIPMAV